MTSVEHSLLQLQSCTHHACAPPRALITRRHRDKPSHLVDLMIIDCKEVRCTIVFPGAFRAMQVQQLRQC